MLRIIFILFSRRNHCVICRLEEMRRACSALLWYSQNQQKQDSRFEMWCIGTSNTYWQERNCIKLEMYNLIPFCEELHSLASCQWYISSVQRFIRFHVCANNEKNLKDKHDGISSKSTCANISLKPRIIYAKLQEKT